jgi:Protein of unknown function (DUF2470)
MTFGEDVVAAVLRHMNDDHTDDSLVIVRGFAAPRATAAIMTGLDAEAGEWSADVDGEQLQVRVPWLGPVAERADIRREVVALYDAGLKRLGLAPREPH